MSLFYQSVLSIFNQFNLLLQREDPCIHLVHDNCESLLRNVLGKFVKTEAIATANCLSEVNTDTSNQCTNENILVGFVTEQMLQQLEQNGDCSPSESMKFYSGVRKFYTAAVSYIVAEFLLADKVLIHSKFVNFEKCHFSDVDKTVLSFSSIE